MDDNVKKIPLKRFTVIVAHEIGPDWRPVVISRADTHTLSPVFVPPLTMFKPSRCRFRQVQARVDRAPVDGENRGGGGYKTTLDEHKWISRFSPLIPMALHLVSR